MLKLTSLFVILCSFVGTVLSDLDGTSQLTDGDPDLAAYLKEAIENFRTQMTKGIPAIKMPVLDPLELHDLDVDIQENVANINLHIKELLVEKLSNFTILDLNPNLEEFFLHLNLSLPEIFTSGHYKLYGKIYTIFPLYGEGRFDIDATKIHVGGIGKLYFAEDTVQMETLTLDLHWETLNMDLENFLNGSRFSQVMLKVIPGVGRDVFNRYKPLILDILGDALKEKVNEKLQSPDVKKIIKGLLDF